MPTIRVDEQIAKELDLIAEAQGTNRGALVREAIMSISCPEFSCVS